MAGHHRRRPKAHDIFIFACFSVFLYPVELDGLSVNYTFVLFPLLLVLLSGKLHKVDNFTGIAIAFYVLVFVVASIYQLDMISQWPRRAVSFLVFMAMFSFSGIRIDQRMILAFKAAVVAVSLYFSLMSVGLFFIAGGGALHFEAKDIVGSQRYGFVYVLAFWVAFLWKPVQGAIFAVRYLIIGVLLVGMLLTFSRASLVAFAFSLSLWSAFSLVKHHSKSSLRQTATGFAVNSFAIAGVSYLAYTLFPVAFSFYSDRLFRFATSGALATHLADPATSEGTRVYILQAVWEFVQTSPIVGSGFLGVWTLEDTDVGSAHNQYVDVLLRTGLIGLVIYCALLVKILKYLAARDAALFFGLVGILTYGLFHETFKESQGAFIFAFLLGLASRQSISHVSTGLNPERIVRRHMPSSKEGRA